MQAAEMSTRTNLDPESAHRVMALTDPVVNTVRAPDPMALVRQQLDALQAASSAAMPQTPGTSQPTTRGGRAIATNSFIFLSSLQCVCAQVPKQKGNLRREQLQSPWAVRSQTLPWPGKPLLRKSRWPVPLIIVLLRNACISWRFQFAGMEIKKELGQLQSLKLEVEGKAMLNDAERAINGHIAALTTCYQRRGQRHAAQSVLNYVPIQSFSGRRRQGTRLRSRA